MGEKELLELYLPKSLLEHFDLVRIEKRKEGIELWFDEKDTPPQSEQTMQSKGFVPAKELRDFPIRGKPCYLKIRRRRWQREGDKKYMMRNIKLTENGTKLVTDFALFFEGRD